MAINNSSGCNNLIPFVNEFIYLSLSISIIVCLESVLIIVIVCRTPGLHSNIHILVASFSVTDLLIGVFYIANGVTSFPELRTAAPEPNTLASFVIGFNFGADLISVIHMAIIAVDRCVHISRPFYYMKSATTRRTLKLLFCVWIIGLTYTAIPLLAYSNDTYHQKCIQLYPPLEYYSILALVYLLGSCLVCACYLKIAIVAFKHKKAAIARRRTQTTATEDGDMLRNSRRAAMKSIKFFVLTFGLFSVCSFPSIFATAVNYFHPVPQQVFISLTYLFPINSFLNFPLYAYMNRDFSQALRTRYVYLKRCCCK